MQLITPNPILITEDNVRVIAEGDEYMQDAFIADIAKNSENGIVFVWTLTQKIKTNTTVEITNRYNVKENGEVLPA